MRAVVAFQTTYDYIDTLAEQPSADPVANGRQLHLALLTALDPDSEHGDYYQHSCTSHDNGYIRTLVDAAETPSRTLPSYGAVAGWRCGLPADGRLSEPQPRSGSDRPRRARAMGRAA